MSAALAGGFFTTSATWEAPPPLLPIQNTLSLSLKENTKILIPFR